MENDTLLTINEASGILRVAPATLRGWVFYDKIDYVKINGSVRFKRSDLQKMIEAGCHQRSGERVSDAR
jgi:hypothetical protein